MRQPGRRGLLMRKRVGMGTTGFLVGKGGQQRRYPEKAARPRLGLAAPKAVACNARPVLLAHLAHDERWLLLARVGSQASKR